MTEMHHLYRAQKRAELPYQSPLNDQTPPKAKADEIYRSTRLDNSLFQPASHEVKVATTAGLHQRLMRNRNQGSVKRPLSQYRKKTNTR